MITAAALISVGQATFAGARHLYLRFWRYHRGSYRADLAGYYARFSSGMREQAAIERMLMSRSNAVGAESPS